MTKKEGKKNAEDPINKEINESETTQSESASTPEEPLETSQEPENEADTLTAEIAQWKEKYEKLNKEYLLSRADFENYRKRTLKEKAELIKSGGENCLKDLLPIIDDFERGLAAINNETDPNAIKEGVELIYKKFMKFLHQHGIEEIKAKDEPFDTEFHEAVTTFPAPSPEQKGKVIDCIQKGYTLNGKVIRYAKVVVGE